MKTFKEYITESVDGNDIAKAIGGILDEMNIKVNEPGGYQLKTALNYASFTTVTDEKEAVDKLYKGILNLLPKSASGSVTGPEGDGPDFTITVKVGDWWKEFMTDDL